MLEAEARRYAPRAAVITDKVRPHHLERKALLYVRQSSAHQVRHNRGSSALQYAMRGWSEIEVIDDDLGRTTAGGVQRAGFERCRSLPRQGRRRSALPLRHRITRSTTREPRLCSSTSIFHRPQQPGLSADRDVSRGRDRAGRSGNALCAEARQGPAVSWG
jgi:hypothetical protein